MKEISCTYEGNTYTKVANCCLYSLAEAGVRPLADFGRLVPSYMTENGCTDVNAPDFAKFICACVSCGIIDDLKSKGFIECKPVVLFKLGSTFLATIYGETHLMLLVAHPTLPLKIFPTCLTDGVPWDVATVFDGHKSFTEDELCAALGNCTKVEAVEVDIIVKEPSA